MRLSQQADICVWSYKGKMACSVNTDDTLNFLVSALSVEWMPYGRRLFDILFPQRKKSWENRTGKLHWEIKHTRKGFGKLVV